MCIFPSRLCTPHLDPSACNNPISRLRAAHHSIESMALSYERVNLRSFVGQRDFDPLAGAGQGEARPAPIRGSNDDKPRMIDLARWLQMSAKQSGGGGGGHMNNKLHCVGSALAYKCEIANSKRTRVGRLAPMRRTRIIIIKMII